MCINQVSSVLVCPECVLVLPQAFWLHLSAYNSILARSVCFFDFAFCFVFIRDSFDTYAVRCIHRHLCIHRVFYEVHSQCIERTALHVIILHLSFFAFLVGTSAAVQPRAC